VPTFDRERDGAMTSPQSVTLERHELPENGCAIRGYRDDPAIRTERNGIGSEEDNKQNGPGREPDAEKASEKLGDRNVPTVAKAAKSDMPNRQHTTLLR
jgi:hypothetical protein